MFLWKDKKKKWKFGGGGGGEEAEEWMKGKILQIEKISFSTVILPQTHRALAV